MKTLAVVLALFAALVGCNAKGGSNVGPQAASSPTPAGVPTGGRAFVVTIANWTALDVTLASVETPSGVFASRLVVPAHSAVQVDVGSPPPWIRVDLASSPPITLSLGSDYQATDTSVGVALQ